MLRSLCAPLLVTLAVGCATRPPLAPSAPPPAQIRRAPVRLAWLPVDGLARPQVAGAFNRQLEAVHLPDVDQHTRAPVSMEVAQLSIECIQPQPRCYQAVGRQLQVERLLWAELAGPPKRSGPLKATVVLFDVERMLELHRAQQEFAGPDAAVAGFPAMLQETVAAAGGARVAARRPAPRP